MPKQSTISPPEPAPAGADRPDVPDVLIVRRVNTRLFILLTALVVVLGTGSYFLHAFQLKRSSHALLERAEKLREEGEIDKAAAYLHQYIGLRPDEIDSRVFLAELQEEVAVDQDDWFRVFRTLEEILRRAPDRDDLRRKQIEVALRKLVFHEERRFHEDARFHIDFLLGSSPEDGELHFLLGLCARADLNHRRAVEHFQAALDRKHHDPEVYATLADVLRRDFDPPQSERADAVIGAMIDDNPNSAEAFRRRARYRRDFGSLTEALDDAEHARTLDPNDVDILLLTAELTVLTAEQQGRDESEQARALLEHGLKQDPEDHRLYETLSWVAMKQDDLPAAAEALRRGLKHLPDQLFMLFGLGDVLIRQQARDGSHDMQEIEEVIDRLRKVGRWEFHVSYLEARVLMDVEGRLPEARDLFLRARGQISRMPEPLRHGMVRHTSLRLADCYGRLGAYEEQVTELRRVIQRDEEEQTAASIEARRRLVAALQNLGRIDEAQEQLKRLPSSAESPLQAAALQYRRTLELPRRRQNWRGLEEALAQRPDPAQPGELAEWRGLRANVFLAQGKIDEARRELQALQNELPDSLDARVSLARLEMIDRRWDRARNILNQAKDQFGDTPELRIGEAVYWSSRAAQSPDFREQAQEELDRLAQGLQNFSVDQQDLVLGRLAQIHLQMGERTKLLGVLTRQAELRPHFIPVRFELFNVALQQKDYDLARQTVARLREIEGPRGHHVRMAQVMLLIDRAENTNSKQQAARLLEEARLQLVQLATQRAGWHLAAYNMGRIYDMLGEVEQAVDQYIEALRLGHANPAALNRAVQLLISQDRHLEFQRLVQQLKEEAPILLTKDLHRAAAHVSLSMDNLRQAVQLAQDAVPADSSSPADQLWLGQMLAATGYEESAERALRRAVELDPADPGNWIALVRFLARTGRQKEAEGAVEAAQAHLPPAAKRRALGPCYELIGRLEQAERQYQAAVEAAPDDPQVLERASEFYLRANRPGDAEPLLRQLMDPARGFPKAQAMQARRALAVVIASRDYPHFQEAISLLEVDVDDPRDAVMNQRIKARLFASRPGPQNYRRAAALLEDLESREVLPVEDQYYLAVVYDRLNESEKADERWRKVLDRGTRNPLYLAAYVRRLLSRGRTESALAHINTLEDAHPGALAVCELKARLRILQDRPDLAVELMRRYIEDPTSESPDRSQRMVEIARILENQIEQDGLPPSAREQLADEAERLYRKLMEERPADSAVSLARLLGRLGRVAEALDACEPLLTTRYKSEALAVGLDLALQPDAPEEQCLRVQRWLEANLDENDDNLVDLMRLAEFHDNHGHYDQAEALYRKLLEKLPNHYGVMNNLAWLLSVRHGRHDEAEALIGRAIEIGGPLGALLDTRATILLGRGEVQAAIEAYSAALSQSNSSATHYRLALAYAKAENREAAQRHWQTARQSSLNPNDLHPLERPAYAEFAQQIEQRR